MTPERLLIELRVQNIDVRADGNRILCRAQDGRGVPADLAAAIRELKPDLLELLRAEVQESAWRIDAIGARLINQGGDRTPGVCSCCGAAMPGQQTGKCVLCCLAAAELVLARLDSTEQTTYPLSADPPAEPEASQRFWDMPNDERNAA